MVLDNVRKICRLHPDGGGVVAGVNADDAVDKVGVQKERHLPLLVIEKAQGRHGTRLEPHNEPKVVGGRKRERARTAPPPELLKVDASVAHERYEVVGALLVVAHKEVLGVAVGVRQLDRLELRHAVDRRALGRLVRDAVRVEAVAGLSLVHHHAPPLLCITASPSSSIGSAPTIAT